MCASMRGARDNAWEPTERTAFHDIWKDLFDVSTFDEILFFENYYFGSFFFFLSLSPIIWYSNL